MQKHSSFGTTVTIMACIVFLVQMPIFGFSMGTDAIKATLTTLVTKSIIDCSLIMVIKMVHMLTLVAKPIIDTFLDCSEEMFCLVALSILDSSFITGVINSCLVALVAKPRLESTLITVNKMVSMVPLVVMQIHDRDHNCMF